MPRQKIYCYVDEAGQDTASRYFTVVAVVSTREQEELRQAVLSTEQQAGVGRSKWHDAKAARRLRYIELALERKLGAGEIFFGSYRKPLPYFFPMLDVLEQAIQERATPACLARVFVDGIDQKKAAELTNALRVRGISLAMVKSRRDESEPAHPVG